MRKFSNRYIFIYSALLVAVVAIILAVVAVSLKPLQQRNQQCEKKQMLLRTIGVEASAKEVEGLYEQYIEESVTSDGLDCWKVNPGAAGGRFQGKKSPYSPSEAMDCGGRYGDILLSTRNSPLWELCSTTRARLRDLAAR